MCRTEIEGQFYERKSKRTPDKLAETICAFANSNRGRGGLLAVGISDDGQIDGLHNQADLNLNSLLTFHHFSGTPTESNFVECINKNGHRDEILLIYVPYLENRVAETSKYRAYVRRGDKTEVLRDTERRELEYSKGQISFEDETVGRYSSDSFVDELLQEFHKAVCEVDGVSTTLSVEQLLLNKNLLKKVDGELRVTKAALLLFAKDPCARIPGALVTFHRYSGTEKKTGREDNTVKEERFSDPLPRLVIRLRDFLRSQFRDFHVPESRGEVLD